MIGILDVNIEELYDPPIFTEIETLIPLSLRVENNPFIFS